MIDLREIEHFRDVGHELRMWGNRDFPHAQAGVFRAPSMLDGADLRCIVSAGLGEAWDHVSVSRPERCPAWEEMDQIARIFFRPHETAMQLHVPRVDHVNFHPYCLHLWRPRGMKKIPRPPAYMLGPMAVTPR